MLNWLKNLFFQKSPEKSIKKTSHIKIDSIKHRFNQCENLELVKLQYFAYSKRDLQNDYILSIDLGVPDCVDKRSLLREIKKTNLFSILDYAVEDPCTSFEEPGLEEPGDLYVDLHLNFKYKNDEQIKTIFLNYFGIKYEKSK